MAEDETQLYLIAPALPTSSFGEVLERVLDQFPVACLRIRGEGDEDGLGRAADMLRQIAHAQDVAVVIDDHVMLAQRHGLDGVHLTRGSAGVRAARKALGADAIVGAFCRTSRHDGLNAGEAGADYVSFGPVGASGLGAGEQVPLDLLQWWSEVIEVPVVAEGAITAALLAELRPVADFVAIGDEIWTQEDPCAALAGIWR